MKYKRKRAKKKGKFLKSETRVKERVGSQREEVNARGKENQSN